MLLSGPRWSCILGGVRSPLDVFAGLLDRSVEEIAALAADGRTFDILRIAAIADIWDNNTFPLVRAATAGRGWRAWRARSGLRWMADLGSARRALMVDLDPALDRRLPAPAQEDRVYRDYLGRVRPGVFPITAQVLQELAADYDLAHASVRRLAVAPGRSGLQVRVTVAAPRRFTPGSGRVAPDGSHLPWPAAPLHFTFDNLTRLRFDADDRIGVSLLCGDADLAMTIGQAGALQGRSGSVWPEDPCWHESAAGRSADTVTPPRRRVRRRPARTPPLGPQEQAAARALRQLMWHVRMVRHPELAPTIPVRELCRAATGSGSAITAAASLRGPSRQQAFTDLAGGWRDIPERAAPTTILSGPATLRYLGFDAPHQDDDRPHEGSAITVAAVPNTDPAQPWRLAGERFTEPTAVRLDLTAFDGVHQAHREADSDSLTLGEVVAINALRNDS